MFSLCSIFTPSSPGVPTCSKLSTQWSPSNRFPSNQTINHFSCTIELKENYSNLHSIYSLIWSHSMFVEWNYDIVECKHDEKWNVIRIEEKWITNNDDETVKLRLKLINGNCADCIAFEIIREFSLMRMEVDQSWLPLLPLVDPNVQSSTTNLSIHNSFSLN